MSSPKEAPDWLDEILENLGNEIAELHKKFYSDDKREKLSWDIFNGRCRYVEKQAKAAISQHIAEQVEAEKAALLGKYLNKVTSVTGFDDPSPMELVYELSRFAETFREMERELAKLRREA